MCKTSLRGYVPTTCHAFFKLKDSSLRWDSQRKLYWLLDVLEIRRRETTHSEEKTSYNWQMQVWRTNLLLAERQWSHHDSMPSSFLVDTASNGCLSEFAWCKLHEVEPEWCDICLSATNPKSDVHAGWIFILSSCDLSVLLFSLESLFKSLWLVSISDHLWLISFSDGCTRQPCHSPCTQSCPS